MIVKLRKNKMIHKSVFIYLETSFSPASSLARIT